PSLIMVKKIFTGLLWSLFLMPQIVLAQNNNCLPGSTEPTQINGVFLPEKPCGAPDIGKFSELLLRILNIALLAVGLVSVLFVVLGGYQYITAGGDEEKLKKGKGMIVNALIGLVIVLLALVIVRVTANLVGNQI